MAHTPSAVADKEAARKDVTRVTWAGVWCNLFLAAFKIAAGMLGSSQAVVADGVHSLSDLVTDAAIIIGAKFWSAPADERHPHGHGRIEILITAGIGLALALVALGIGWEALQSLQAPGGTAPGPTALAAALASIVIKEWIYRWTMRVARRTRSSALTANAWHHRTDAISSIPAAIAVFVAFFAPEWAFVDPLGALLVCLFILKASRDIGRPALDRLIDRAAPREKIENIYAVAESVTGVRDVHKVRTRYVGPCIQVDLHVEVDPELSVRTGHEIAHAVRNALMRDDEVEDVIVHVEPHVHGDE